MALPVLDYLFDYNLLSALICPEDIIAAEVAPLQRWASKKDVPCWQANQRSVERELEELIRETKPQLVVVFGFPYSLSPGVLQDVDYGGWNIHFSLQQENKGTITIHQLVDGKSRQVLQQLCLDLLPEGQSGTALHQLSHISVALLNASLNSMGVQPETKRSKQNNWALA